MNLSNIDELKNYLRGLHLRPKDYLGQNFLVDEIALDAVVAAGEIKKTDTVLEVGPGLGVLTRKLVERAGKVLAVEKDKRLIDLLKKESRSWNLEAESKFQIPNSRFQLVNQDILSFHVEKYVSGPYKVIANIPYYLTSKLIQNFLERPQPPTALVLMIQKEVGERIVAGPGELSVLGISVQVYADAEIIAQVPRTSFWPSPEVDSVIIKIVPREKYQEVTDKKLFFRLIKQAFAGKRKQIHNTIKKPEALAQAGIDPKLRPQDLSIEQWIKLYEEMV